MSTAPPATSETGFFRTAIVPFFHTAPQQGLLQRFQRALTDDATAEGGSIRWRPDTATDFRGYNVPTGADRLVRWDYHSPDHIFYHGFEPPLAPRDQMSLVSSICDVGAYVDGNLGTVFVGTVRYYQDSNGAMVRWVPRDMVDIYEYEVFASGGIDVQSTLGPSDFGQNDQILFPGGIRREFIRSARQYNKNGKLVSIWYNPYFDVRETGAALYQLPNPVCTGDSIDVHYQTGLTGPLQRENVTSICRLLNDPMRGEGAPTMDEWMMPTCHLPRPARAAFTDPMNTEQVYWFSENHYAIVKFTSSEDRLVDGPKQIINEWAALREARFSKIDAILPTGHDNEVYFFSQNEYILINVRGGPNGSKIVYGPGNIPPEWTSLKEAGCTTVDAILPRSESPNKAYIFCSTRYAVIGYKLGGGGGDWLEQAPRDILENWPTLSQAGFTGINTLLSNPNALDEVWFFSGEEYLCFKFELGMAGLIVAGPKRVSDGLQSLKAAGFYGDALKREERKA